MAVSAETYAAKQRRVTSASTDAFLQWVQENPGASLEDVRAQVLAIARQYGAASAEMAVEFYMDHRAAAEGIVEWEPEAYEGYGDTYLNTWTEDAYLPDDPMLGMGELLQVAVQQAGRDTITRNARKDPAGARWARMPIGKTCSWCLMLASRGAAYFTKASAGAASGNSRYHGSCDCQPVPVFPGQAPPYDAEKLYDLYRSSREALGDGHGLSDRDIAAQMRRDHADLVLDGVHPDEDGTVSEHVERPAAQAAGQSEARAASRAESSRLDDLAAEHHLDARGRSMLGRLSAEGPVEAPAKYPTGFSTLDAIAFRDLERAGLVVITEPRPGWLRATLR